MGDPANPSPDAGRPGPSPDGPQQPSFEERLQELETLAERLKDGEVPLAEAVDLFERGMNLARGLGAELAKIERRIEVMINEPELEDGEPDLEPFADDDGEPRRDEPRDGLPFRGTRHNR